MSDLTQNRDPNIAVKIVLGARNQGLTEQLLDLAKLIADRGSKVFLYCDDEERAHQLTGRCAEKGLSTKRVPNGIEISRGGSVAT